MAGLAFATKLRSNIPFLGRDALEAQRARPLPRLLAGFSVADPSVTLLGRETIYRDGRRVGWLASAGWGYTVGASLGYGYVRDPENGVTPEDVLAGSYELEVATERVPAEVFLKPPYDPAAPASGPDPRRPKARPAARTRAAASARTACAATPVNRRLPS